MGAITVGKAIHSESEDSGFQEEDIHVQVSRARRHYTTQDAGYEMQ